MHFKPIQDAKVFENISNQLNSYLKSIDAKEMTAINLKVTHSTFGENWKVEHSGPSQGFVVSELTSGKAMPAIVGVDLPILVTRDAPTAGSRPIVMIIAQDPLRNTRDFPGDPIESRLIVGTPYAFHSGYYTTRRTKLYADIVQCVLGLGFDVYLTDVHKIGYTTEKNARWNSFGTLNDATKILAAEMQEQSPRYAILFGNTAKIAFDAAIKNMGTSPPPPHPVVLPHPSNAANAVWAEVLRRAELPNNIPNRLAWICEKLKKDLNGN